MMSNENSKTVKAVDSKPAVVVAPNTIFIGTKNGNFCFAASSQDEGLRALRALAGVPASTPDYDKKGTRMLLGVHHYRLSPQIVK